MEMKYIISSQEKLFNEGRWDIDYHLPLEILPMFNDDILIRVKDVADVVDERRNPENNYDKLFKYVDIASINIHTGEIVRYHELFGDEAPSRARKVIKHNDIIISTVRPTRGAIAIVPKELDNQICSTGFCVIRPKKGIDPVYLHFALRLDSTKEQFRKFSTGSSYPAILDTDVEKTIIPMPEKTEQKKIARELSRQAKKRKRIVEKANKEYNEFVDKLIKDLSR
jgi:type I restriction enzyme S subunit